MNETIYLYDSEDNLVGFTYAGNTYFYVRNYMNDIMGITDSEGTWLVKYSYDAWGSLMSTVKNTSFTDMKVTGYANSGNSMKYRGYYYDSDVHMYYLQSRYYNLDTFRFLNADLPEYAKELKDDYAGINLFAYCCNNPVNSIDPDGCWTETVHNGYNKKTKSANKTTVKGGYYYYGTYFWALECGFSTHNAKLLGEYCIELDRKYPSTKYAAAKAVKWRYTAEQLNEYKRWQYFHFNKNKSGQDSRTSFCLSRRNWAVDEWNKGHYKKALNYLGYAIHAVQDYHAHGQIGRGLDVPQHIVRGAGNNNSILESADNINYVWSNSGWTQLKYDSYNKTRLVRTGTETKKFINVFLSRINNKSMIKGKIS